MGRPPREEAAEDAREGAQEPLVDAALERDLAPRPLALAGRSCRRVRAGLLIATPLAAAAAGLWLARPLRHLRGPALAVEDAMGAVALHCAALGADCRRAGCCATPGHQCFRKNAKWAACRPFCTPGRDPTDKDAAPWSCEPIGEKRPGAPPPPNYTVTAASWVQRACAGPGESCEKQRCCKEPGKQCFRKSAGWSACKAECVGGGPDPTDRDGHPWDCKELGMRTPGAASGLGRAQPWVAKTCSGQNENCFHSRCCKDAGLQCYLKRDDWAMCLPRCKHGPLLTDANSDVWNCTALGGRTPGIAKASASAKVAPWVATNCSKPGADCRRTMCCSEPTMQCYSKSSKWASCDRACAKGPRKGDGDGKPWDCQELGVRTPRPWGSPSLYCFHVIRISSYEHEIASHAVKTDGGIGIFGCDQFDVFASDGEGWIGDGPYGPVWTHHFDFAPVTRSVDNTAGNTALFMNVWEAVRLVGRYKLTDWTVKADPDAVVIPARLRAHLMKHTGKLAFVKNCNSPTLIQTGPMMFGSLEAISRSALDKYFYGGGETLCKRDYQFGEDRWLGNCLTDLGVWGAPEFDMVGDALCVGTGDVANCANGRAVFHPHKSLGDWIACYNTAMR